MERVVVTGLGTVTAMGRDPGRLFDALCKGQLGVTSPKLYPHPSVPTRALGEVSDTLTDTLSREFPDISSRNDRRTLFGYAAGHDAMRDANIDVGPHPRGGVFLGSGPGVQRLEDISRPASDVDATHAESLLRHRAEAPAHLLAEAFELHGPVHATTTACASSNHALGAAFRAIQCGEIDFALAGGADSMHHPIGLVFFVLLGISTKADEQHPEFAGRPFDRKRTGHVMSEGAGCVVLESEKYALARGARIYAEVSGYGSTMDAFRLTAPPRDGRGAAGAMQAALNSGSMAKREIDVIHAHGTGTKRNDPAEVRAIHSVFGDRAHQLAVVSSKGALGHALAAAGGISFVCSVLSMTEGRVPPTVNCDEPDPLCDLDFVPKCRTMNVRGSLNNTFAFGGHNACITLRAYPRNTDAADVATRNAR